MNILSQLKKQAKAYFKQRPTEVNDFITAEFRFTKEIEEYLADYIPPEFCLTKEGKGFLDIGIAPGFYEFQKHNISIDAHTDDIRSTYMAMLVVDLQRVAKSPYDSRPDIYYTDAYGKKHNKRLNVGDFVIFNPRKLHQVIYYGDAYTVMLFSVQKKRKRD